MGVFDAALDHVPFVRNRNIPDQVRGRLSPEHALDFNQVSVAAVLDADSNAASVPAFRNPLTFDLGALLKGTGSQAGSPAHETMAVLGRKTPRRAVRFCRSSCGIWLSAAALMQLLPIVPI
jgi:hypothetical protein